MQEIKLYKSPWKAIRMLLLTSVLVALGYFLIFYTPAPAWIGWLSLCLSGLGIPVGLFHLFDRRPQIIINEVGIWDRTTNQETINWNIIQNAYLVDVHRQKFICLQIDEAFEPSKDKEGWSKKMAKVNKSLGFQEVNLSLGQVKIDEVRLTAFINAMLGASSTERHLIDFSNFIEG